MSTSNTTSTRLDPAAVADFHGTLKQSKRIVAIVGAGLSAASGLATFREASGPWTNQDMTQVASPAGFRHDPGMVWQFYTYRRQEALRAKPNPAHYALAELARRVPGFITLTQNVDNLSQLAGHPADQMKEIHGNLFTLSCFDKDGCGHVERDNFEKSLTLALDPSRDEHVAMGSIDTKNRPKASPVLLAGIARKHAQILGDKYKEDTPTIQDLTALKPPEQLTANPVANVRLTSGLTKADLPQCPKCETNLLRPGVVWFGEPLSVEVVEEAEAIFKEPEPIDLCLVIGTSSSVWPAAGYAEMAKKRGARVAVVNIQADDAKGIRPNRDWVFVGDAAIVLPELLKPIVGEIETWEIPKGLRKQPPSIYSTRHTNRNGSCSSRSATLS